MEHLKGLLPTTAEELFANGMGSEQTLPSMAASPLVLAVTHDDPCTTFLSAPRALWHLREIQLLNVGVGLAVLIIPSSSAEHGGFSAWLSGFLGASLGCEHEHCLV